jgi:AcrR family transcriptional regulator
MNLELEKTGPDGRRQRIMDGAMAVVLRYGFQRTTMDDVAKEAGISRPALYLLFKNKTEIYQALPKALWGTRCCAPRRRFRQKAASRRVCSLP